MPGWKPTASTLALTSRATSSPTCSRLSLDGNEMVGRLAGELLDQRRLADAPPSTHRHKRRRRLPPKAVKPVQNVFSTNKHKSLLKGNRVNHTTFRARKQAGRNFRARNGNVQNGHEISETTIFVPKQNEGRINGSSRACRGRPVRRDKRGHSRSYPTPPY